MSAHLLSHIPDDEVLWFLEAEGVLPMRPIRERWPELFAVPPPILPEQIIEYPEVLPGHDGPIIPVPELWYPGMPLPAIWEPEETPGYGEQLDTGHAAEEAPVAAEAQPAAATPDWLAERRKHGAVPAGRYPIEILPAGIDTFTTRQTTGIIFSVRVAEGEWQGGEIRLRFVLDGPSGRLDGVVRHNLDLLARWAQAVGAGVASDPIELVARLGRGGRGRRVVLDIREKDFGDRREIYCARVEVS